MIAKKRPHWGIVVLLLVFCMIAYSQNTWRDSRVQPERVMDVLGIEAGMVIGEAGSGRGYLTFKLSRRVGKTGRVYANDISKKALTAIEKRCREENVTNIITVMGEVADPLFPEKKLELVIMLMAFHDFAEKEAWLQNVQKYMAPGARLVIIERHDSHTGFNYEKLKTLVENAGFKLIQYETFLPEDFIYVFRLD